MKELKSEVSKFYKDMNSWLAIYDDLNGALKVTATFKKAYTWIRNVDLMLKKDTKE